MNDLTNVGFLSSETRNALWGDPRETMTDLGEVVASGQPKSDLEPVTRVPGVNSIRFYPAPPDAGDCTSGVLGVYYPKDTSVLDCVELVPKLKEWIGTTTQSMGNWVSRERIVQELRAQNMPPAPVYRGDIPAALLNTAMENGGALTAVGFDVLQIPRCRITLVSKGK